MTCRNCWRTPTPAGLRCTDIHLIDIRQVACSERTCTGVTPKVTQKARNPLITMNKWWPGRELNPRRQPFQGWIRPELSLSKQRVKAASMSRKQPIYWDKNGTRDSGRSRFALSPYCPRCVSDLSVGGVPRGETELRGSPAPPDKRSIAS